jgi:threonine aldolase
VPAKQIVDSVDSVSLCLSKGLGTPAGSVLVGAHDFIARARRMRKLVGGGMRQVGILAAAGIYALDHHIDRLADDHVMARRLADQLNDIGAITVNADLVETNMLFMTVPEGAADPLRAHLASRGILLGGGDRVIRLVTHLDIDVKAADQFAAELADFFQ